MPNRLIALLDSGRITDEAVLKRAFRSLAKRLHPDLAGGGEKEAAQAFMRLRAEYEEALAWLAERRGGPEPPPPRSAPERGARPPPLIPLPWSIRSFYENLEDLLARGFPRAPRPGTVAMGKGQRGPRELYEASRETVMRLLAGRDWPATKGGSLSAFLDFEEGYAALAGADPAGLSREVRLSHGLRNLLSNILGFHETGFVHLARYVRNEWPRLEGELCSRGETRPLAFLALLVSDMEVGPACADF